MPEGWELQMPSLVIALPDVLATVAQDLTGTTAVVAAAGDEVSSAISALFGGYGQQYQALGSAAQVWSQITSWKAALDG
jgi:hypothetical protein